MMIVRVQRCLAAARAIASRRNHRAVPWYYSSRLVDDLDDAAHPLAQAGDAVVLAADDKDGAAPPLKCKLYDIGDA